MPSLHAAHSQPCVPCGGHGPKGWQLGFGRVSGAGVAHGVGVGVGVGVVLGVGVGSGELQGRIKKFVQV
jgi:hypothetical protein